METKVRMRTIPQAVEELKKIDPDCHISQGILRNMVKRGEVPSVKVGKKWLINLDRMLEVFSA